MLLQGSISLLDRTKKEPGLRAGFFVARMAGRLFGTQRMPQKFSCVQR